MKLRRSACTQWQGWNTQQVYAATLETPDHHSLPSQIGSACC